MTPTNPFFKDEIFYLNLEQYLTYNDIDKEEVEEYESDYTLQVEDTILEPAITIDKNDIERIIGGLCDWNEERLPEDYDKTFEKLTKAFTESFDMEKFNQLSPKLWYPNGKKITITKQDLIDSF